MKANPFAVVGTRELCAWTVARGVCWIQTRNPKFADLLKRRQNCRRVAWSVAGGYLRIFEEAKPLRWAERLIRRYTATTTGSGSGFSPPISPADASRPPASITTAATPALRLEADLRKAQL